MKGFWPIYKRELFAFFVTPLAWVQICIFLLVQGMHFFMMVSSFSSQAELQSDQTPIQTFFGNTVLLYLVLFILVPPMTMRLFAEERRSGTIETLMTAPVSTTAVVIGKYLAGFTVYLAMWLPTLLYLFILRRTGVVDWQVAGASYLGVLLVGGGYLSIGLFMSALTRSQFLALIGTAVVLLVLFILGIGEFVTPAGSLFHDVCSYVSVWAQMNDFASGLVDSRRLVYDATLIALPLFFTVRVVDTWKSGEIIKIDSGRVLQASGIAAAVVLAMVLNTLSSRHFRRWDVTRGKLYTLTSATTDTLHGLKDPVEVWVLLGGGDPLEQSVKQLLLSYRAETDKLDIHYVDPDRDFVALQDVHKRFNVGTDRTDQGRVVTDAVMVVAHGDRHWFLLASDMFEVAGEDTRAKPREEQAITGAIRNVLGGDKPRVCFTTGHGELSLHETGDEGLGTFRDVLEKNNYEPVAVDTTEPNAHEPFKGCALAVIAGPRGPFAKEEEARLKTYVMEGGSLLLAVGPVNGDTDTGLQPPGLGDAIAPFGIALDEDLVFEMDSRLVLPGTKNARFIVTAQEHPVTAGLVAGDDATRVPARVVVHLARSLHRISPDGAVTPRDLLTTSDSAFGVKSVAGAAQWGDVPEKKERDQGGPLVIGMAAERSKVGPSAPHGPRVVVVGTGGVMLDQNWRQAGTQRGAAVFVENAIAWLCEKPHILDVPAKAEVAAGLKLTDDQRSDVRNYVLIYLPLAAAFLGGAVAFSRRHSERRPRKRSGKGKEDAS